MNRQNESKLIDKLARHSVLKLVPYSSARGEFSGKAKILLDANENTLGSSVNWPGVCSDLNRYPDPLQIELRKKAAKFYKVSSDQVFVGNGSDEAIDLLIRVFCNPGKDCVLITPPSYGMYEVIANIQAVKIQRAPLDASFDLDPKKLKKVINSSTKIVFICSPNNPTANAVPFNLIKKLAAIVPGILVVDEAYIDFANQPSATSLLSKHPNVVVLRTMSKAWGLAGIRVGYALAHPRVVTLMQKVKAPYNVSAISQSAALKAFGNVNFLKTSIATIKSERQRLLRLLIRSPDVVRAYKSDASFLLVKFKNSKIVFSKLLSAGIVARDRNQTKGCEGCIRIAIGTPSENNALLKVLGVKDAVSKGIKGHLS